MQKIVVTDNTKPPKPDRNDAAHTLVKAGLGSLPIVGAAASELFNAIISPPLSRRRDAWLTSLAEGLQRLDEKVERLNIEKLSNKEVFVTTVLQASEVAVKNHQVEKLEALKNAVLNTALDSNPAEDVVSLFLRYVDVLTALHLRILDLIHNPKRWFELVERQHPDEIHREGVTYMYAYSTEMVFKDYEQRRELYNQVPGDLRGFGLIEELRVDVLSGMRKNGRSYIRYSAGQPSGLTSLGEDFLRFINPPGELD